MFEDPKGEENKLLLGFKYQSLLSFDTTDIYCLLHKLPLQGLSKCLGDLWWYKATAVQAWNFQNCVVGFLDKCEPGCVTYALGLDHYVFFVQVII